jgi:hypothetical protein
MSDNLAMSRKFISLPAKGDVADIPREKHSLTKTNEDKVAT